VVIAGNVQGNVEVSEKITIQRNGSLIGDIKDSGESSSMTALISRAASTS